MTKEANGSTFFIHSPLRHCIRYLVQNHTFWTAPIVGVLFASLVRWAVALNPYSGYNTPPMYGDYEAQRHWMEITTHLPTSQWYRYDLPWWGLDYPPLTAFHSWFCGIMQINPAWFALDSSRGFESPESKFFMRSTVFVSEALVYVPAVLVFCQILYGAEGYLKKYIAAILILMQPALLMIDHGHFQYNSVMLGLSLWAINGLLTKHYILGSIFFCASLAFKQMALYYAPAVFAFLLGKCFKHGFTLFLELGVTVIVTFGIAFAPWITSLDDLLQVVHRIFPVARGLYEDKVANVWCALNIVVKLRQLLSLETTLRISLLVTLAAVIPISINLGLSPSRRRFIYALVNSSLAFFLFSFQVHEKSILLPALPITLLIIEEPVAVSIFMRAAMFSMFPLLKRDGLALPYFVTTELWSYLARGHGSKMNKAERHATMALDQDVPDNADVLSLNRAENKDEQSQTPSSIEPPFSYLDYLRDELTVSDFDSGQELKRERVTNFLGVPGAVEKLMVFGLVVCLDSFLYSFTILPIRFCFALYHYLCHAIRNIQVLVSREGRFVRLKPSEKCDLLKGLLVAITCVTMSLLDSSRLYHFIRGQAVLKLYVVFNVLEIFDKLCCSVGVDILDALFSKSTLGDPSRELGRAAYARRQLRPFTLFFMAAGYMVIHTVVLFFQMITLNVAINFYSNALLSLLISNQFVEIKQAVFKKFEKENLFQLSCSDIVERFQQMAFLAIITLRNVAELSGSSPSSILPSTFVPLFTGSALKSLSALMTPVVMVVASELVVDWLKHAFITKFNQIRPSIYSKYIDVLCKDLVMGSPSRLSGKKNTLVDQSPVVSRRIGFPVLPLVCLHIRMVQQLLPMIFNSQNDQSGSTSSVSSMITNGLLNYWMDNQGAVNQVLPARIQLVVLSLMKCGWLERGLDHAVKFTSYLLLTAVIALCLLALKVLVGIHLLGYAHRRHQGMEARDQVDKQNDKKMKEMEKEEEQYRTSVRDYLDDPNDNVMGKRPIKYTLDNVDRFSMVRSRIP
ncbi:hypothetical protein DFQ28_005366 [Apophysomyces sp. BC1034]|nr:hypothetical protein DFQ28_005366 [Apophysomyces sp. BC1034]